jgi:hypothetical protein
MVYFINMLLQKGYYCDAVFNLLPDAIVHVDQVDVLQAPGLITVFTLPQQHPFVYFEATNLAVVQNIIIAHKASCFFLPFWTAFRLSPSDCEKLRRMMASVDSNGRTEFIPSGTWMRFNSLAEEKYREDICLVRDILSEEVSVIGKRLNFKIAILLCPRSIFIPSLDEANKHPSQLLINDDLHDVCRRHGLNDAYINICDRVDCGEIKLYNQSGLQMLIVERESLDYAVPSEAELDLFSSVRPLFWEWQRRQAIACISIGEHVVIVDGNFIRQTGFLSNVSFHTDTAIVVFDDLSRSSSRLGLSDVQVPLLFISRIFLDGDVVNILSRKRDPDVKQRVRMIVKRNDLTHYTIWLLGDAADQVCMV